MKNLIKTKSFWTGVGAIITGASGYFTGAMTPVEAMQTVVGGLAVIFLRDGIRKIDG